MGRRIRTVLAVAGCATVVASLLVACAPERTEHVGQDRARVDYCPTTFAFDDETISDDDYLVGDWGDWIFVLPIDDPPPPDAVAVAPELPPAEVVLADAGAETPPYLTEAHLATDASFIGFLGVDAACSDGGDGGKRKCGDADRICKKAMMEELMKEQAEVCDGAGSGGGQTGTIGAGWRSCSLSDSCEVIYEKLKRGTGCMKIRDLVMKCWQPYCRDQNHRDEIKRVSDTRATCLAYYKSKSCGTLGKDPRDAATGP